MLVLSEKEVRRLIDIEELIQALERAHVQFSTGKAVMPVRLVVPLPEIKGRITSMPAYLGADKALGMKVVTYFPENPKQGLPMILASVFLYSTESGRLLAVMDGTYITSIRTACVSAFATRALANPETPALGVLGAGVQARAHIRALCRGRKIRGIKGYDVLEKSVESLKEELEPEVGIKIEPAKTAEEAVRNADLLVTVTTAKEPIVSADWLRPGGPINAG